MVFLSEQLNTNNTTHTPLKDAMKITDKGVVMRITPSQLVYKGNKNPWVDIITNQALYEPWGLFKKITKENVPKVLSGVWDNGMLVSYAMCWQGSRHIEDTYQFDRHTNLGWTGVFTLNHRRGQGFAEIAVKNLIAVMNRHMRDYTFNKPPVMECEERVLNLFNRQNGIITFYPRWIYPSTKLP